MRRAATLALLLQLLLAGAAAGEEIGLEEYGRRLRALDAALATGDGPEAAALAASIGESRIAWGDERLAPDPALLADARSGSAAARRRIAAILPVVDAATLAEASGPGADPAALEAIRAAQRERALRAGGEFAGVAIVADPRLDSLVDRVVRALSWIRDRLGDLMTWLKRWFQTGSAGGGSGGVSTVTFVVVGAIVAAIALLVLLRRRTPAPATDARVVAAAEAVDADPRSRAADDWRRYAAELAAAGRWRESVRAHYHAVLAMCWMAGLLQHRTGRTNWEYAAQLPSQWRERQAFVDLTAGFDRAWYGGQAGPEEARVFAERAEVLYLAARERGR